MEQLSSWAISSRAQEPQLLMSVHLEPVLHNERSHLSAESSSHLPQLEKALGQQQRPSTAKKRQTRIFSGLEEQNCHLRTENTVMLGKIEGGRKG